MATDRDAFAAEFPFVPGDFWFVLCVGSLIGEEVFDAVKIEGWAFADVPYSMQFPEDPIGRGDLVDPRTGDAVEAETDFVWFLVYPHEHHLVLHAGTANERCVDLSDRRRLPTVNKHNAVHIGVPGTHAFQQAGTRSTRTLPLNADPSSRDARRGPPGRTRRLRQAAGVAPGGQDAAGQRNAGGQDPTV